MAILALVAILAIFCLPLYCLYTPAPVPACRGSVAKGFAVALAFAVAVNLANCSLETSSFLSQLASTFSRSALFTDCSLNDHRLKGGGLEKRLKVAIAAEAASSLPAAEPA